MRKPGLSRVLRLGILFEAPWLDAYKLASDLNAIGLEGVHFQPIFFTPTFSKHEKELCQGVQLYILDRHTIAPVRIALHLLKQIKLQNEEKFEFNAPYTEKGKPMIDYNTGSDAVRLTDFDPETLYAQWEDETRVFREVKKQYHLYS